MAWTGKSASKVSAHYYVTGNGSAVVEDLSNGMTSVYHLDGGDLRVTHLLRRPESAEAKGHFLWYRQQ